MRSARFPWLAMLLTAGLANAGAPAALAEEAATRSAAFVALAALAPTESFLPVEGGPLPLVQFGDRDAARHALAHPSPEVRPEAMARFKAYVRLSLLPGDPEAILPGLQGGWPATAGFALDDAAAWLTFSAPPNGLRLIRLDPGKAAAAMAALPGLGYAAETGTGGTILVRGDQDLAISLADRNPADPFGGALGKSSRVTRLGDVLVQAPSRTGVLAALSTAPKGHADLPALAVALDDPAFGAARLVQAFLVPLDVQMGRETLPAGDALPVWSSLLLADLSDGTTDHAAAIFVFPSRAAAEAARATLTRTWADAAVDRGRTLAKVVGPDPQFRITGDGPATLTADLPGAPGALDGMPANVAWSRLMRLYFQVALSPFSPG